MLLVVRLSKSLSIDEDDVLCAASHYEVSRFPFLECFFLCFLRELGSDPVNTDSLLPAPTNVDFGNMHAVTMLDGMIGKLRTAKFSCT